MKISKRHIASLLNEWSQEFSVFVPSREEGVVKYVEWDKEDTSFLDWYRNTVVPAKALFFPQVEQLFHFCKDNGRHNIELPDTNKPGQLIFGIRPCDAKALRVLDLTFSDTYEDQYYLARRKNGRLVGMACANPFDSCFCTSLDGSPSDASNVDLMLTDIGDDFLAEPITEEGKTLLGKASMAQPTTKADETKAVNAAELALKKMIRSIDIQGVAERLLAGFNNERFWESIAAKCVSCGICTLLCPTCHCFDINDELVRNTGERFRSWDSCAFAIYTKMPMENPRKEKWRRLRQKVSHKYAFYPMNHNLIACTGCGRCIRLCPVNWDITQTISSLVTREEIKAEIIHDD